MGTVISQKEHTGSVTKLFCQVEAIKSLYSDVTGNSGQRSKAPNGTDEAGIAAHMQLGVLVITESWRAGSRLARFERAPYTSLLCRENCQRIIFLGDPR